jgi:hypothetical protein
MHKYRVVQRWTESGLCVLKCSLGRYHVARALSVRPPARSCLGGDKPHLGFGILQCVETGAIYRVIFESINEVQPGPLPWQMHSEFVGAKRAAALDPLGHAGGTAERS